MARFYGGYGYTTFSAYGYNATFQKLVLDENGVPTDTDWSATQAQYVNHLNNTSAETPYLDDPNAFYGDVNECQGFVVVGEPESGYKYCEY